MAPNPILPGAAIGILGSGQLGRMMAIAAKQLGYRIHCYSPEADSPAGQVCDREWVGQYDDVKLLREFATGCQVVTYEFENVPLIAANTAESVSYLAPASSVLSVCQDRILEKGFLKSSGIPVPEFYPIGSIADIDSLPPTFAFPAVLKTARLGYDGRGQSRVGSHDEVRIAFEKYQKVNCILETFVDFQFECSVIVARNASGQVGTYPTIENQHANHILDISLAPARVSAKVQAESQRIAKLIAERIELTGLLAVELFVSYDDRVLVNELAPRPHNSGHLTIEACSCSQFQQVIRAICNLPLGTTELKSSAGMLNLLGDLWQLGEPNWRAALENPAINLHLYGKQESKIGRKMGHLTLLGDSVSEIETKLRAVRAMLK